jgi:hypothetical protein
MGGYLGYANYFGRSRNHLTRENRVLRAGVQTSLAALAQILVDKDTVMLEVQRAGGATIHTCATTVAYSFIHINH